MRRLIAVLARLLRRPAAEQHLVRGFRVRITNTRADIASADVLQRFREALELIAQYQPRRFAHLTRDVSAFEIRREAHRGHYQRHDRVVLTELTFLARRDISAAVVASSILHEGVHARIHRFAPASAGLHPGREERICRKAELRFGLALPEALGAPVIARARAALDLADEELWVHADPVARRAAIAEVDGRPRDASGDS